VAGHPAIARDLLRYALEHSWDRSPSEWRAYERVDLALEELATCEEALGHLRARDEILGALSSHVDGLARASAVRARGAVRRGDLDAARREVQYLRGTGWTADRAALAIEIALLTDAPRMAARVATTDEERDDVCGDYFERLRLAAYRRLLEHLAPSSALTALGARLGEAADDDSEFLYAAAMRSLRSDLDVAACLLLERFLESGRPAERRLFEDGRRHFDAANERAKRKARKKTLR